MKLPLPALKQIQGAHSWRFATDMVEAFLTRDGGHLAPVTFQTAAGPVQPFSIAPWTVAGPVAAGEDSLLKTLRGDFFCLPFGGNAAPWKGERHPAHGETANRPWKLLAVASSAEGVELRAEMRTSARPGRVLKRLGLRRGETNVYLRHELHGLEGPMCLGHHAMLAFPPEEGCGHIALSPWHEGRVCPVPFEVAEKGGYFSLKTNAPFRDLRRVPLASGGFADLSSYPARAGYEDLVMVSSRRRPGPAWTTVAFPAQGYLWFGLKDPRTLASTVLWHSNRGRHYAPWSGRHERVLGLEEVTSYFHFGLAESAAANPLSRRGVPTVLRLRAGRPLAVNYIMGVVAIPKQFDRVRTVRFLPGRVALEAESGATVDHRVDWKFLGAP